MTICGPRVSDCPLFFQRSMYFFCFRETTAHIRASDFVLNFHPLLYVSVCERMCWFLIWRYRSMQDNGSFCPADTREFTSIRFGRPIACPRIKPTFLVSIVVILFRRFPIFVWDFAIIFSKNSASPSSSHGKRVVKSQQWTFCLPSEHLSRWEWQINSSSLKKRQTINTKWPKMKLYILSRSRWNSERPEIWLEILH